MQALSQPTDGNERDSVRRDKKGRALAAMGHVARTDEGFEVTTTGRRRETMRVWRDASGRIQCSCPEFSESDDAKHRCEHILAVKYYLEPPVDEVLPPEAAAVARHDEGNTEVTDDFAPAVFATPAEFDAAIATTSDFAEVLAAFKRPLSDELVKQRVGWTDRQGREHEVDYVEWHVVADILDEVYPEWSHAVRGITQIGGLVAVTASITIGSVTREGIGTGEAVDEKGIKKAEHDALKRAAVKFGIARELYRKDGDFSDSSSRGDDPVARTLTDLITPKQLVAIRAIANASGVDAEQRALELFNCRPEELTKRAASTLIDDLKQGREGQGARRAS